jgi:hypothetical protein
MPDVLLEDRSLLDVDDDVDPDCVIEFSALPSWNDLNAISGHIHAKSAFTRRWRFIGEKKVIEFALAHGLKTETYIDFYGKDNQYSRSRERLVLPFFTRPVAIDCRVWRPDARPYDIDNICLKAAIDGFVDARLIIKDDTRYVKQVTRVYEGVDQTLALTKDEKDARATIQRARALRGKPPKRMPTRARFRVEFFSLS